MKAKTQKKNGRKREEVARAIEVKKTVVTVFCFPLHVNMR